MNKQGWLGGVAALALVFAVARVTPGARPIFDGSCVPDPYHYLTPPSGVTNGGTPQPASKVDTGDQVDTIHYIATSEQPPQAQFEMGSGVLNIPHGVTQITLDIHPVAPPPVPADGPIQGNVYSETISANGSQLSLLPGKTFDVELTAPKSKNTIVVEEFASGKWQQLATQSNLECSGDGYAGGPSSFGLFALVDPAPTTSGGSTPSGTNPSPASDSGPSLLEIGGGLLLIALLVIVWVRVSASRES